MKIIINLCLLLLIAFIIGEQRANTGKAVGFRSLAIAMLGAFAFSRTAFNGLIIDYHVIAQIISGVSFIGRKIGGFVGSLVNNGNNEEDKKDNK